MEFDLVILGILLVTHYGAFIYGGLRHRRQAYNKGRKAWYRNALRKEGFISNEP